MRNYLRTSTDAWLPSCQDKDIGGQWRQDLVGLERKLQRELDEGPQVSQHKGGRKRFRRHDGMNS